MIPPLVQSHGDYNISVTNATLVPNGKAFSGDVILFSAVVRYRLQMAAVARTMLVDPTPEQLKVRGGR